MVARQTHYLEVECSIHSPAISTFSRIKRDSLQLNSCRHFLYLGDDKMKFKKGDVVVVNSEHLQIEGSVVSSNGYETVIKLNNGEKERYLNTQLTLVKTGTDTEYSQNKRPADLVKDGDILVTRNGKEYIYTSAYEGIMFNNNGWLDYVDYDELLDSKDHDLSRDFDVIEIRRLTDKSHFTWVLNKEYVYKYEKIWTRENDNVVEIGIVGVKFKDNLAYQNDIFLYEIPYESSFEWYEAYKKGTEVLVSSRIGELRATVEFRKHFKSRSELNKLLNEYGERLPLGRVVARIIPIQWEETSGGEFFEPNYF